MKKILLLGDSIRLVYQDTLKELLKDVAVFYAPADNCRSTTYTMLMLEEWLKLCPDPDVIVWNNGAWDLSGFNGEYVPLTNGETYKENIERIYAILKPLKAAVIFPLSTPYQEQRLVEHNKSNARVEKYNELAKEAFEGKEGEHYICDLYTPVLEQLDTAICEDGVHLSDEGKQLCAGILADMIRPLCTRKEVLIMGDSITLGYRNMLRDKLAGEARVSMVPDNCRFGSYLLRMFADHTCHWPKHMDVVQFNFGIWDYGWMYGEDHAFIPMPRYLDLIERVKNACHYYWGPDVKVVFASTTPNAHRDGNPTIHAMNMKAKERIESIGGYYNDIYTVVEEGDLDKTIGPDTLHLSDYGYDLCAEATAKFMRKLF